MSDNMTQEQKLDAIYNEVLKLAAERDDLRERLRAMTAECDELRAANAQLSERLQGERARILALLSGMHIDEVKS